jgi:hypothetical protein
MNPTLTKNHTAGAAVEPCRIVKHGTADGAVIHATNGTAAALIGVTGELGAASGERVDVHRTGIVEIKLGGTVARGAAVTSGADGVGVAAAPATGVNSYVIGYAEVSGVSGDIIDVMLAPGLMQGA